MPTRRSFIDSHDCMMHCVIISIAKIHPYRMNCEAKSSRTSTQYYSKSNFNYYLKSFKSISTLTVASGC